MPIGEYEELFLRYNYAEAKDLCKQFITVVTSVLVVSLTFSDKVIGFAGAGRPARSLLVGSWVAMMLAIMASGTGLVYNALAGGQAVANNRHYAATAQVAYAWIIAGGALFMSGLLALIGSTVLVLRATPPLPGRATLPNGPDAPRVGR